MVDNGLYTSLARCLAAIGPDPSRLLDSDIGEFLSGGKRPDFSGTPNYTSSLDVVRRAIRYHAPEVFIALVQQPESGWRAALLRPEGDDAPVFHYAGPTAEVALLRALVDAVQHARGGATLEVLD